MFSLLILIVRLIVQFVILNGRKEILLKNIYTDIPIYTHIYMINFSYICYLTDLAVLIKHTRVPLSCDTIWSIHPVLDTRTVHIVLCIHHLLLLFNNNTNSLLLRRLLWDWLVASQERWVCTKLPMYVLSTFLLPFHNCRTTLRYRGRDTHRKVEIRRVLSEGI